MPVDFVLEKGGSFVHVQATGRITSDEINDFLIRLGKDPALQGDHVTLFDATEVTAESLEDGNFEKALEIERGNPEKLVARKMAIVVKKGALYPFAMKYKFLAPTIGEPTHVFTELADALLWLSY
jgi:hypothetical protein